MGLTKLRAVFIKDGSGTVTAGNASGMWDLQKLRAVFIKDGSGTVTAGNASGMWDLQS